MFKFLENSNEKLKLLEFNEVKDHFTIIFLKE